MTKNAIVFTANSKHVAQANLMIESLFDPDRGNFQGDLWVISTDLDNRTRQYLDSWGINYLINPLVEMQNWSYRTEIAKAQPEFKSGEMNEHQAFNLYRNKRMSKLIINDWVEKFGDRYEQMALCDNDLYFQRDVNLLFDKCRADKSVIWYWQEEFVNHPGTNLWKKNFHYSRFHDASGMDFGQHEINIGFIISTPQLMADLFQGVKNLFSDCHINLFSKYLWHDQDLVRVIRAKSPGLFRLFEEGDVVHLCNGGKEVVQERSPQDFFHKKTGERPTVLHFAGGAWRGYPSVAASYMVDHESFFHMNELSDQFDSIRQLTDYDPFDAPSRLFDQHNIETRDKARAHWIDRRKGSDKKSALFFTWLNTGGHHPMIDQISDILADDTFDLAVIDGNVSHLDHEDLVFEDLPDLLAHVTQTVKRSNFARAFGYRRADVPEEAISGAMAALIKEYRCSERAARAVSNAAYFYLVRALAFYKPDVAIYWGSHLFSARILKHLCRDFGIPMITTELAVLPQTLTFDCLGHMGASWVSQDADGFNGLPVDDSDLAAARDYLLRLTEDRPSRNLTIDTSERTRAELDRLRDSDRKVVLYCGSNDPMSGNVPYGDEAKRHHSPYYADNDDVVRHLSEIFAEDDTVEIVYKPHPITITRGLDLTKTYPGITVLANANLGECLEVADLAVVKVSQASYEAVMRDIPVLMLGKNQINGSGAVYLLQSREGLKAAVRDALATGFTAEQRVNFESHVARLLKYATYNTVQGTGAREQSQFMPDIHELLFGTPPAHLKAERSALAAYRNPTRFAASETPRLSIVMPVFNGETYLADAIGSILNQTMPDFELICVNNGSTDNSQRILDYFDDVDPRVKVVWQEEPNQRAARNLGVSMARGEFLQFFDCDDLIAQDAYQVLLDTMQDTNANVLYFFFKEMYDRQTIGEPRYMDYLQYIPSDPVFEMEKGHKVFFAQYPFPWAKIFNREYLINNELLFDLDCANFDDNPQNLRTLLSPGKIVVANRDFYRFRINDNSMTQSVNPRVLGMIDAIRIMNEIYIEAGEYRYFQPFYVPYKVHLTWFAWQKLPEDLRRNYFHAVPSLFLPGDEEFFQDSGLFSTFPYYNMNKVELVQKILAGDWEGLEAAQKDKPEEDSHGIPVLHDADPIIARVISRSLAKYPKLHSAGKQIYRSFRPRKVPT